MQPLVKYFISLLLALLFNLIPGKLALEHSSRSPESEGFALPSALCGEDNRLPAEEVHVRTPVEEEFPLYTFKGNCS